VVDALVYASGARDLTVTHCDVSGGIEDGIGAYRTSGVAVRDNTVHDNGTPAAGAVGIAIYSDGASVSGNTVVRNSAAGVLVDPRSSSVQITSNRIDANAKEGVVLGGTDITVEDNQVDDNGADRYAAVSINGGHAVTIAGNSVTDNRYGGIAVQNGSGGRASDVTLTGNRVTGNGSSPTDQIIVEPGERVNANWHSVNTVRFSPSLTGWPFGLLAGVVALAGTGAYIDAWHRRTKRAR
jgi:parallel beta-helix repeat protein